MTTEAKVGLFTIIALGLALAVIVQLSNFKIGGQSHHYKITVSFNDVNGLKVGAMIRYAGVAVGDVVSVETDGTGAQVVLKIKEEVKIPKSATITTSSDGLMGEKLILIYSDGTDNGIYLTDGDTIKGTEERNIAKLVASASLTIEQVNEMVTSINKILGNSDVQNSLIDSAINLKKITGNLDEATAVIARMAADNEGNINLIVSNMLNLTSSLQRTADSVENMVNQLNGDGMMAENIRTAVANLASTSARIERMAANLEPAIADPQTAEDLRNIIHNTSNVSKRADNMMARLSSIKTKVGADILYSGKKSDLMLNADLRVYTNPNSFLLIGGDDIGGDNPKTNLQMGTGNDFFSGRVGLVDNKAGVGIDTYSGPWKFSLDAYDTDNIRLKFRGQYRLKTDLYLLGQVNDVNRSDDRTTYLGIRKEF